MIPEASTPSGRIEVDVLGENHRRWVFRRNCSLTPRQLMHWYFSLCVITAIIAGGFWYAGFWIVLPFAGLELFAVGVSFLVYARHAADYEMIELGPRQLRFVMANGQKVTEIDWQPQWAKLSYNGKFREPLLFSQQGQQIKIGKFIAERDKPVLHKELRAALARAAYAA